MPDTTRQAVRLLEQAQSGEADAALASAEELLRAATGDMADGPACLHFVRVAASIAKSDCRQALAALGLMLSAAEREESGGWQATALATRAWQQLRLGETDPAEHNVDDALRDLVAAETLAAGEPDPVAAVNARVALAIGYGELRLYELVEPQFLEAYEMSVRDDAQNGNRAMWLINLAEVQLRWALELYMINQVSEAESHSAEAGRYAMKAAAESLGDDAVIWRDNALLYAACSRADRHDPKGAAADIERQTGRLLAQGGFAPGAYSQSRLFYAVALSRSGRVRKALTVMEEALGALPPDADWLVVAITHRTHALMLTKLGSGDAEATMAYGDTLAAALWRQRLNTLHAARTMHDLKALRLQHEQVSRDADRDALTGIPNRRAFDRAVELNRSRPGGAEHPVTVMIVDTDHFKSINDRHGHAAGDAALRSIAAALAAQTGEEHLLARLGGDEFAVLLTGVDAGAAREIATRMVHAVRDIPACPATVSVGVAAGPAAGLPETVRRADEAMYRVKRAGGDGVRVSVPDAADVAA